jgi:photosystem II stability/assembly factor-like uncharacterized protein
LVFHNTIPGCTAFSTAETGKAWVKMEGQQASMAFLMTAGLATAGRAIIITRTAGTFTRRHFDIEG